jgi:hypothetical protein
MKASEFTDMRPLEALGEPEATTESNRGKWSQELDFNAYADSSVTLPGKGDRGKNCGKWYPQEFCNECGEPRFGESRCLERSCPECWRAWRKQRAVGIIERLQKARETAGSGLEKRLCHVVASPTEGEITSLVDVDRGFRDAYEKAKEAGIHGGTVIFHGFRVTTEAKQQWAIETDSGDNGPKLWQWVREHNTHWRELTYWSPHYHILGIAPEVESDDSDDWIIERIRTLDNYERSNLDSYRDIAKAAMYIISHTTFESNTAKDSIRWYGSLSTAKFSADEQISSGVIDLIERKAAESVDEPHKNTGSGEDETECECDVCGSTSFSSIFEAGGALMDIGWCNRIDREQEHRLNIAFQWAIGELHPPPGLKNPSSEAEAREAFQELL